MTATRELDGVVMDPEHVALVRCLREKVRWAHCISTCISACFSPRVLLAAWEKILFLEASKKEVQITVDGIFLGHQIKFCAVCRIVKRRPREDAADPVFFNSIRGTPKRLLPDDDPGEPREPREQPLQIDVRLVHTDFPPPINTEPAKPRRVCLRNSIELARYGYFLKFIGFEAAVTRGFCVTTRNNVGLESSKPCLQMPTSVHESGKRMKESHVQYLMRPPEPNPSLGLGGGMLPEANPWAVRWMADLEELERTRCDARQSDGVAKE